MQTTMEERDLVVEIKKEIENIEKEVGKTGIYNIYLLVCNFPYLSQLIPSKGLGITCRF